MTRTVVHYLDSDTVGGAERVALQVIERLDPSTWRPVLLHHDEPGLGPLINQVDALGIEHRVVPRMMTLRDLGKQAAFIQVLREVDAEVFHAHLFWPLSCKYGLIAARRAHVPAIIATAHTRMDLSRRPLLRWQPRLLSGAVDRFIAVSNAVAEHLRDGLRLPAAKTVVIPNGVDVSAYEAPRDASLRRELFGEMDRPLVLCVARLSEAKGQRDLLQAAGELPGVSFALAGDGPLRDELVALASKLGISGRVMFLGQRDDVPALLRSADLFVLPSHSEGMPLSVLEAMATRTPVVASDIPGVRELIHDGQSGALVPPNDPKRLAEAIGHAIADPGMRKSWADRAYQRVSERHHLAAIVSQVEALYMQVLGTGKPTVNQGGVDGA